MKQNVLSPYYYAHICLPVIDICSILTIKSVNTASKLKSLMVLLTLSVYSAMFLRLWSLKLTLSVYSAMFLRFWSLKLTLSVYSAMFLRLWSRSIHLKLSRFLVSARARGRILALSTSRFNILDPAARH